MATLDTAYLKAFPESLGYHSMKEYSYNNIQQYNRNHLLLKDPTIDGLKTGYIAASGYHLSATSKRDGMRLIAVVMGAQSSSGSVRGRPLSSLTTGSGISLWSSRSQKARQSQKPGSGKGKKTKSGLSHRKAAILIPQSQKNLLKWEIHTASDVTAPSRRTNKWARSFFWCPTSLSEPLRWSAGRSPARRLVQKKLANGDKPPNN